MNCHACNAELVEVYGPTNYQYDNALWLTFDGGYAMFIDVIYDSERPKVVICHDCAHRLCDAVPWIKKLLNPALSHSHLPGDWEGHEGWDLPHKEEV